MTPQEIDHIKCAIRHIELFSNVDPWAAEIAVEAMRKQIPQKAVKDEKNWLVCPNCKKFAISGYCRYCGQLIDNLEEGKG